MIKMVINKHKIDPELFNKTINYLTDINLPVNYMLCKENRILISYYKKDGNYIKKLKKQFSLYWNSYKKDTVSYQGNDQIEYFSPKFDSIEVVFIL